MVRLKVSNRCSQQDQYRNYACDLRVYDGKLQLLNANNEPIAQTPGGTGSVVAWHQETFPEELKIGDLEISEVNYPVKIPTDTELDILSGKPISNSAVATAHNLLAARVTVNEEDIDDLEAEKVNIADIIDDLDHTDTDKPLSAKQGKVLKELIEESIDEFFDAMHPVGSYAFGPTAPTRGTWVEVTGDRALWLKNTVADGTEIAEGLPELPDVNVGSTGSNHVHGIQCLWQVGEPNTTGSPSQRIIFGRSTAADWGSTKAGEAEGAHTHPATYGASAVYGASTNVQPNALVLKVWKRTV